MYELHVPAEPAKGVPELTATFGRISVLMGANGSGKSKLLTAIRDGHGRAFGPDRPITYIEGGRVVPIPSNLPAAGAVPGAPADYDAARRAYEGKRAKRLASRIVDSLLLLERQTTREQVLHSDAVTRWTATGRSGECPDRGELPLQRLLRLFSEALPDLQLRLEQNRSLRVSRAGQDYSAAEMSDGERQTLVVLADIAMYTAPNGLVLVDEPELYLHPLLASTLWSAIERDLPDAVFIYASHSLGFAMRREVEKVIITSYTGPCIQVEDPGSLDPTELRPFLGSIPAILSAADIIFVEGNDRSFDSAFYPWLLGSSVGVVPVGSGADVHAASGRVGVWNRITPGLRVHGVLDRDYRSDERLDRLRSDAVTVLDLHEAESYLCDPRILASLASSLGLQDHPPSEAELLNFVRSEARTQSAQIAAQRAFARLNEPAGISLPRHALAAARDERALLNMLRAESEQQFRQAQTSRDPDRVERIFREELARCRVAFDGPQVDEILRLIPGKELLQSLARRIGCTNARQVLNAAGRHLAPSEFPTLAALKRALENRSATVVRPSS